MRFPLCAGYQEAQNQIFGQLPTIVSLSVMSILLLGFTFVSYSHFLLAELFLLAHPKNLFSFYNV